MTEFVYLAQWDPTYMLYQLPNGKTVYLSLEAFLDLTDEDVQYLVSTGYGEMPSNPFFGSVIKKPGKPDPEPEDKSVDYTPDDDKVGGDNSPNLDDLPDEGTLSE